MRWLRNGLIFSIVAATGVGCGPVSDSAKPQGTLPSRPSIPGELSPEEARAKLREMEKNPAGRARPGTH